MVPDLGGLLPAMKDRGRMIVSAFSYSVGKAALERPAASGASGSATNQGGGAGEPTASDPLAMLDDFVESAAQSRKAFAEDRLKHLKEQMNSLMLFNLAPGFLAGHTARMAKELEGAATDFATSFKTLADLGLKPELDPATAADSAPPLAYLDVLLDDAPAGAAMSTEDAETAASFMSAAYLLRGVVELMADDAKDSPGMRRNADAARDATARVTDLMARLESAPAFGKITW
ncbi:hypothetical protein LL06_04345 [Hoeflea sp. BAL378]|uniref:hypothetical protein n=1 Tax=Hoeflea sp. BAL378 TaxID=1547437 RepID=UPI0005134E52|nr:hypothetical protein [Hoeflea sp. BAL378]KGF70597.1 hypothetical protein LL06_04345 [Hoeflea sp. BAL378]